MPENVWDLRCTEDGIFEFRRGEFPEYYSPYSNEIISPNGCDIVFYGGLGYKIYNESKTKGVLFIYGKEKLNFYDDYFPLRSYDLEYMAVRQNGKVGLVRNGVLQGRIRYDQINNMQFVGSDDAIKFLFFIGDSCGVMTANGQELMQPKYANILETSDEDRFIVLDRELAGVVDRTGKTIIPLQYDYISYEQASQLFVVQHKKKIGLFRRDGSQLVPIAYAKYSSSFSSVRDDYSSVGSGIHILGNGDKIYFANSTGLIDGIAYNHYDYTAGVLKAYKTDGITVFALNPNGSVEEVTTYPLYRPATIEKDYRPFNEAYLGWHVSLLEENQQKGYFGLRYYSKRGFGVEPSYRTVRVTVFANCLGEVAYQDQSIPWLGDIPMTLIRSYDELKPGSGSIENERLFNSETIIYDYGSDDRRINFTLDR